MPHVDITIDGERWAADLPEPTFTPAYVISQAAFEAARAAERATGRGE
jgi:hypothetical protein